MGEWKVSVTLRIKQIERSEMEQFAVMEGRTPANVGALLLVWALDQLKIAGSTERLLKLGVSLNPSQFPSISRTAFEQLKTAGQPEIARIVGDK